VTGFVNTVINLQVYKIIFIQLIVRIRSSGLFRFRICLMKLMNLFWTFW